MDTRFVTLAIIICVLGTVRFSPAAEQQPQGRLPEQIDHYYATCNAVNLYSTASERGRLIRSPQYGKLPDGFNTNRLRQIHTLMHWIASREHEIDPQISRGPMSNLKEPPAGLAIVEQLDYRQDKMQISVIVYPVDKELNFRNVSEFDLSSEGKIVPPSQEKIKSMIGDKISRQEIHTWVLQNGTWIKQAVNLVLLDG